jgi:CheY-like chemotaxis protein
MQLLQGKQIFIVEDNFQNRIVFQMALVRHGAVVEFERWGSETIYRLKNLSHVSQIDLVLLDLMLAEGVNGYDVFDEIRAEPKFTAVPIVAVSAMDPGAALPRVRAKGFAGFIAKPIDVHLFPKQLAAIIDGEHVWHKGGAL